jgi:hypothetical protein
MENHPTSYSGYLAPHLDLIRALHEGGRSTREIAEALYRVGVRSQSSGAFDPPPTLSQHIQNLQGMTLYALRRLGLRRPRRVRNLTVKPLKTRKLKGIAAPVARGDVLVKDFENDNRGRCHGPTTAGAPSHPEMTQCERKMD